MALTQPCRGHPCSQRALVKPSGCGSRFVSGRVREHVATRVVEYEVHPVVCAVDADRLAQLLLPLAATCAKTTNSHRSAARIPG